VGRYDHLLVRPLQRASAVWANSIVGALNELYDNLSYSLRFQKFVTITANYTANAFDFILADGSSSPINITLPSATGWELVFVKKVDSTSNPVTIFPQSGSQIDLLNSYQITANKSAVLLIADTNGKWWVISKV